MSVSSSLKGPWVVVAHIAVTDRLVGVDDVPDLGHGAPDTGAFGRRQYPLTGDGAGRVPGGEEQDIVTGILETAGQLIHDQLDPAVQEGGDGSPRWGDHSYPHGEIQASRRGG